jgi:hypothetical protein
MKKRERTYACCGKVVLTFSKAPRCTTCAAQDLYSGGRNKIKKALEDLGHTEVTFGGILNSGKISVSFLHPVCGTQQTWQASNITKVLKADPNTAPCSHCGAKRRTAEATRVSALNNGIPDDQVQQWADYSRVVRKLTERTYKTFKTEINPLNLDRGLKTNHLDHKFSIVEGFLKNIDPKIIASKENLQMLPSTENISKGRKCQTASSF